MQKPKAIVVVVFWGGRRGVCCLLIFAVDAKWAQRKKKGERRKNGAIILLPPYCAFPHKRLTCLLTYPGVTGGCPGGHLVVRRKMAIMVLVVLWTVHLWTGPWGHYRGSTTEASWISLLWVCINIPDSPWVIWQWLYQYMSLGRCLPMKALVI